MKMFAMFMGSLLTTASPAIATTMRDLVNEPEVRIGLEINEFLLLVLGFIWAFTCLESVINNCRVGVLTILRAPGIAVIVGGMEFLLLDKVSALAVAEIILSVGFGVFITIFNPTTSNGDIE